MNTFLQNMALLEALSGTKLYSGIEHLLSTYYYVLGCVSGFLIVLTLLILTITLGSRSYYFIYIICEKTEALREAATSSRTYI